MKKIKVQYFEDDLKEKLKDPEYKKQFDEELRLLRIGVKIAQMREKKGWTQLMLAKKSHTSQQAISRIEDADYTRYNLLTLEKVAEALGKHVVVDIK